MKGIMRGNMLRFIITSFALRYCQGVQQNIMMYKRIQIGQYYKKMRKTTCYIGII